MFKQIALGIIKALSTEKFIKEIIIYLLKWAAEKSDNTIDNDIVAKIEEAFQEQTKEEDPKA